VPDTGASRPRGHRRRGHRRPYHHRRAGGLRRPGRAWPRGRLREYRAAAAPLPCSPRFHARKRPCDRWDRKADALWVPRRVLRSGGEVRRRKGGAHAARHPRANRSGPPGPDLGTVSTEKCHTHPTPPGDRLSRDFIKTCTHHLRRPAAAVTPSERSESRGLAVRRFEQPDFSARSPRATSVEMTGGARPARRRRGRNRRHTCAHRAYPRWARGQALFFFFTSSRP